MERKGAVLSKNIALAKQAELLAEKERVKMGLVPVPRVSLIERTYSHVPKELLRR